MQRQEPVVLTDDSIPDAVAAVFATYPEKVREKLFAIRRLILETASVTEGVGPIEEALRWNEPSYLTPETKSGSTVRISTLRETDDKYGIFFNCQTTLVSTFRQMYPDLFEYAGNRAILFHVDDSIPTNELSHCVALALRYHLDKK